MYVFVYSHIYTFMYSYTYLPVYIYIHIYIYVYIYLYICNIYICIYMYLHTYVHLYIYLHMYLHIYMFVHTYTSVHRHVHIHSHLYSSYIHTCIGGMQITAMARNQTQKFRKKAIFTNDFDSKFDKFDLDVLGSPDLWCPHVYWYMYPSSMYFSVHLFAYLFMYQCICWSIYLSIYYVHRHKHQTTWVPIIVVVSGDLTGGSPSTSVTVYTKHVHVMFNQQTVSSLQTLGT